MNPTMPTFLQAVLAASIGAVAGAITKAIADSIFEQIRKRGADGDQSVSKAPRTSASGAIKTIRIYAILGTCLLLPLLLLLWRWPLAPLPASLVLLTAMLITIGALWLRARVPRTREYHGVAEAAFVGLLVFGFYFLDSWLPHDLAMDDPVTVSETQLLRGRVTGHDRVVYILLRPLDSSGLIAEKAQVPDCHGNWTAIAHFGGGPGTRFYLTAVALDGYTAEIVGGLPSSNLLERIAPFRADAFVVVKNR